MRDAGQDGNGLLKGDVVLGVVGAFSWSSHCPEATGPTGRELRGDEGAPLAARLDDLDERYAALRLTRPGAVRTMKQSLLRHGQLSPLVAAPRASRLAVVDGFKRLFAAQKLGLESLVVRSLALSEQAAVAAIYAFNRVSRGGLSACSRLRL